MIKNIENLKNIQIVCKKEKDVKNYFEILKKLGFNVFYGNNECRVVHYSSFFEGFKSYITMCCNLEVYFYNKQFIKTLQKFIKEKEKVEDFEAASDGRITKINNKQSEKKIFVAYEYGNYNQGNTICLLKQNYIDFVLKYEKAYATVEARDRAMFKLEIETKLKNIAERLNAGRKIDWEDRKQIKYNLFYNYEDKMLAYYFGFDYKNQGVIYCLDDNFLYVAKKEIGEDNLIKYFTE